MFDIYIKDFNRNGSLITSETKVQSIPASEEGELKLISPIVKNDMGNAESFDFSIEGGTKFCEAFLQMKTFMRVVYDGTTIFMGRVLTVDNGFHGTRKVRCEGPLAFFNDSPVPGVKEEKRQKKSVNEYMRDLINNHNDWVKDGKRTFTLGQVPGQYSCSADQQLPNTERKYGQDSWSDTKAALEDLRSHYGGYFRVRCGSIGSAITLDWMNHYFNSSVNSQTVEVGKNIIDISSVNEIDNIFTAIIPIGQTQSYTNSEGKTSQSEHMYVDGKVVTVPEICSHFSPGELSHGYHSYNDYASAIDRYGYIYKTVTIDDAKDKADLYNKACEWIRNNYQGEVPKFTVKAVDMRQIGENTQKIMVGDRVKIIYPVVHEDGSVTKRETYQTCISISYDLYNPENNSYTFGIPANIMTKSYGLKKQSKSVDQTTSEPKNTESYTSSGGTRRNWLSEMIDWLTNHKIHYDGTKPFIESYGRIHQHGPGPYDHPSSVSREIQEFFLVADNGLLGSDHIWRATKVAATLDESYSEETYRSLANPTIDPSGYAAKKYREEHTNNDGHWELTRVTLSDVSAVTTGLIQKYNLCEYIKDEYGIDLKNGSVLKNAAPGTVPVEDEEGNEVGEIKEIIVEDPETHEKVVITQQFIQKNGNAITFSELGLPFEVKSIVDADGNVHFYKTDDKGNWVEDNNYRQLVLEQRADAEFIGTVVKSKLFDAAGNPVAYQFGQMLEKDEYKGQIVVAYVEGDQVNLGNKDTKWLYGLASRVNQQWVKPVNVTEVNGQKVLTYLDPAGTASYRGRYDPNTGEFIVDPNGPIAFTGSGIWDEKNLALKGGIVTGKVGDDYVTFVKSDRLVIGDAMGDEKVIDALVTAGVVTADEAGKYHGQKLVADAVYTQKLNAVDASISNLKTNKLSTVDLSSEISKLDRLLVRSIYMPMSDDKFAQFGKIAIYPNGNIYHFDSNRYYEYGAHGITMTKSGNTVTLQLNDMNGNAIAESNDAYNGKVSFDIATSLLGEWSSEKFPLTVRDQAPVPHTYTIGFGEQGHNVNLYLAGNGTPTAYKLNEKVVNKYLYIPVKVQTIKTGSSTPEIKDRYSTELLVNCELAYNQGWAAARTKLSIPGTENTSNNMTVKWPPEKVDAEPNIDNGGTRLYVVSADNDYAYIKYGGTVVARASHSAYSNGKSAGYTSGKKDGWNSAIGAIDWSIPDSKKPMTFGQTINVSLSYHDYDGHAGGKSASYTAPSLSANDISAGSTRNAETGTQTYGEITAGTKIFENLSQGTKAKAYGFTISVKGYKQNFYFTLAAKS